MRGLRSSIHYGRKTGSPIWRSGLEKKMPKFFIDPAALRAGDGGQRQVTIGGADAHHLARVLRAKPGDRISVTDGQGNLYEVELAVVTPETVQGDVLQIGPDQAEPALKITLFQS